MMALQLQFMQKGVLLFVQSKNSRYTVIALSTMIDHSSYNDMFLSAQLSLIVLLLKNIDPILLLVWS